jgi:L-seryl-tRNA(Ser) seleniumtransferase
MAPTHVRLALEEGESQVGGGALPLMNLPTYLITVESDAWSAHSIDRAFRTSSIPVVGRINKQRYLLDLRTLLDEDLPALTAALTLLGIPSELSGNCVDSTAIQE